jgi:hypothetical protein
MHMSEGPTPPTAKRTAEKKWPPDVGGQVQGGNAQEGRRPCNREITIPRCSNMPKITFVRKRKKDFCDKFFRRKHRFIDENCPIFHQRMPAIPLVRCNILHRVRIFRAFTALSQARNKRFARIP